MDLSGDRAHQQGTNRAASGCLSNEHIDNLASDHTVMKVVRFLPRHESDKFSVARGRSDVDLELPP
jgi:hypothetical protein